MNKKGVLRLTAGVLAAAMACSLGACSPKDGQETGATSNAGEGKLFTKSTEIKVVISDSVSWPYNENWKIWKYFSEATGANFKVQAIPDADFETKINLMMTTPSDLPDLLHLTHKYTVDDYAATGALIPIDDYLDQMKNYTAFMESLPEQEAEELTVQRKSGDGKIYAPPTYGTQTVAGLRTWIYRKDIFEKHNLKVPETYDEIYQVSKELKKLYPDSYPLCFREGMDKLRMMGSQWKEYFSYDTYYDFNQNKWCYGATEDTMLEMIKYLRKMMDENLVPPDFVNINTKTWEELMSTDRGFITLDYIVRIDYFNLPTRQQNPQYTLAAIKPPRADLPTGENALPQLNFDFTGYTICNTGKQERIENAVKVLDWMYSDEGAELLGWGKEGETYEEIDGRRQFILPKADDSPKLLYGVGTAGLYQRIDPSANEATYSVEQIEECHKALEYIEPHVNPMWWLPFNEEEQKRKTELHSEIDEYVKEMLSKFLLGQEPLSSWDSFQESLKKMNLEELLDIYTQAYDRVK